MALKSLLWKEDPFGKESLSAGEGSVQLCHASCVGSQFCLAVLPLVVPGASTSHSQGSNSMSSSRDEFYPRSAGRNDAGRLGLLPGCYFT